MVVVEYFIRFLGGIYLIDLGLVFWKDGHI
jgi:hypothetical protein